jgi:DNA repair protein RadA/Sms
MVKEKEIFFCSNCKTTFPKWLGQCPSCRKWNSIEKKNIEQTTRKEPKGEIIPFSDIHFSKKKHRISTGFLESDRVLGGGIYPDSLTLLVGNPGIGKSTLALQIAINIANKNPNIEIFIFSGEESPYQVYSRAERIGNVPKNLFIASSFQIENVLETVKTRTPALILVDSVQTFFSETVPGSPGSLSQIRSVTEILMFMAKKHSIPVLLIGQVTKEGEMAGPQTLAHLVDTVLQFEGDDQHELRILRTSKNRFGSTSEVGIFEMTGKGLQEVKNPSAAFLSGRLPGAIGSSIFSTVEGERPYLVEIQALTASSPFGLPKRSSSGISLQRLSLLLAVLEKHAKISCSSLDVFINVIGGFRIEETSADLAVCLAITSSRKKVPIPEDLLILGEVGLSGEIRAVPKLDKRLQEGEKLGFKKALIPSHQKIKKTKLKILSAQKIEEAVNIMLY